MNQYVHSKKRVYDLCKLQGKLAQREYLSAEKHIEKLEISRDQLRMMARQMLDSNECVHSAVLAAKLEFGNRLIALKGQQKAKIAEGRSAANLLQSKAYLVARREERAREGFRQAKKSDENRLQQNQPYQSKNSRFGKSKSKKGMTR